jgi:CrcB protein
MIGFEGVAHAEQRPETGAGEKVENWHNAETAQSYVNILLIAIGGAIGSVCRYLLSSAVLRALGTLFPAGTFVVNVIGCFVFGVIAGLTQERITISPEVRALLLAGVLGGFTTFSSYMNESFVLVREGQFMWAGLNLAGQVVTGFAAFWAAFSVASFR